jgi:Domain of unknown function (DUF3854)
VTLADHHLAALTASGITPEHAALRGYETITEADARRLADIKIVKDARHLMPGLLVPLLDPAGSTWGYQYRPDKPRRRGDGKPVKYETPWQQRNGLDIPPGPIVGPLLGIPQIPLWITEGTKKADAAALRGLCCVAIPGVWSWIGTNTAGGKVALPDWRDCALNGRRVILAFDGDVARKNEVQQGLKGLASYLSIKGARIEYLWLPDTDEKTGLDDYLIEHDTDELMRLVKPVSQTPIRNEKPAAPKPAPEPKPAPQPVTLAQCHETFTTWLGADYDTDALDVMLAAAAVEKLNGDPLWVLLVSGSGNAKTETVQPLSGIDAVMVSTITSDAALLSATSKREQTDDANGGLLRQVEPRGILAIKDVTSILSMSGDARAKVFAALREIHDGYWYRDAGTDGGKRLEWRGRIAIVGAVTSAWDRAHAAIAAMGDRFVLCRIDSRVSRIAAGRKALGNIGSEADMRAELAAAVAGVIAGMNTDPITLTEDETEALLDAANLVTMARTYVDVDYSGNPLAADMPEAPTRFAKELGQIVRGGVAVGMDRADAMRLALRCARDSMPPLRLELLEVLGAADLQPLSTQEVRRLVDKPRKTVDRALQCLHLLGLVTVDEYEYAPDRVRWIYSLAPRVDATVFQSQSWPETALYPKPPIGEQRDDPPCTPSNTPLYREAAESGQLSGAAENVCSVPGCSKPLEKPESIARGRCAECQLENIA